MIGLAKAAKTSMRRIVRRDKGKKVVAEAPNDGEPQNMFSRFKRSPSKTPKPNTRFVPDAATTAVSSPTTTSVSGTRKPRKAMRTAVNKIKQHVADTLERLLTSMRGAQKNLTSAVAQTVQLELQAEQLQEFVEAAATAATSAREQACTASAAVGVLEHLEQQLLSKVKELQTPLSASSELREIETNLKLQHEAILKQKAQVMQWYSNAAEAQAVQERAAEMVGDAKGAYERAQSDMAAAAAALYEAQRASLAAKQMIMQAVSRAHLDDVREESGADLEEEQLVVAERGNEVVVVGHVSLAEKLRMEQGEVWQEAPAELQDVFGHTAVLAQREDYEAATQAAAVATQRRELVAKLAEEVATLAHASGLPMSMVTSQVIQQQLASMNLKKEECETKVRYLTTRLNWVKMAAAQGATDDHPWVANTPLPQIAVDSDPMVVAALEQVHIAKADLMAVERKLAQLDCTARLQALHADVLGRAVMEGSPVTEVATQLMKNSVLSEIRAYRDAKHTQHALQEACEAVQKGVREAKGQQDSPEGSLSRMGLEPKRLQYFMQYYMDNLSRKLSTKPRITTPSTSRPRSPNTPPPTIPSPLSPASTESDALFAAPVPLSGPAYQKGASRSMTNAHSLTNGMTRSNGTSNGVALSNGTSNGVALSNSTSNGVALSIGTSNGVALSNGTSNGVTRSNGSRNGVSNGKTNGVTCSNGTTPANGTTLSNGKPPSAAKTFSNGTTLSNGKTLATKGLPLASSNSTPSAAGPPDRQVPDPGPDIARVRAALQGFLGGPEIKGQATSSSFARPGKIGLSRTSHLLAGTRLDVDDAPSPLEAAAELDSALLDSVRTRLALAQLLERGDNKVVRELVSSQLAADTKEGLGFEVELKAQQEQVTGDEVSEESLERLRHWYALQYMLERAQASPPVSKRTPSAPPSPATPEPRFSNGATAFTSFALSSFSDVESGSDTASVAESDASFTAPVSAAAPVAPAVTPSEKVDAVAAVAPTKAVDVVSAVKPKAVVADRHVKPVPAKAVSAKAVPVKAVPARSAPVKAVSPSVDKSSVYQLAETVAAFAAVEKLAKEQGVDLSKPRAVAPQCKAAAAPQAKAPAMPQPLELAQAFASALLNETVGKQLDLMFSTAKSTKAPTTPRPTASTPCAAATVPLAPRAEVAEPITPPAAPVVAAPRAAAITTPVISTPVTPSISPVVTPRTPTPPPPATSVVALARKAVPAKSKVSSPAKSESIAPGKSETTAPTKVQNAASNWWPSLPTPTLPALNFTPPTWTEFNHIMHTRGELCGTIAALTVASWAGIVAQHMDSAALVSTVYLAAGVAAASAISNQTEVVAAREAAAALKAEMERLAAEKAAAERAAAEAAAAAAAEAAARAEAEAVAAAAARAAAVRAVQEESASPASPLTKAWASFKESLSAAFVPSTKTQPKSASKSSSATAVSPAASVASSDSAPASPRQASIPEPVSPTAASVASSAPSSAFLSATSELPEAETPTASSRAEVEEVKGTWWQRSKAKLARMNTRRPELTGSVVALMLGISGCFTAPLVHH